MQQQRALGVLMLNTRIDNLEGKLSALMPQLSEEDRQAAQRWLDQVEALAPTASGQELSRQLRRGKRLLNRLKPSVPPVAPPPPPAAMAAAPVAAPISLAEAAAAAATARLRKKKCALLSGDEEQLQTFSKFLLREPSVAALVKKGYNPVDAALMNPAQRQDALEEPTLHCYSAAERVSDLDKNQFSYQLADDCYPMDKGKGEFPDLAGCHEAKEENAAQDGINKFLDVAYGEGMTGDKMQFLQWMMQEGPEPVTLWNELKATGIQEAKKSQTVYDQVLPPEARDKVKALRTQMQQPGVDPVTRRTLETQIVAIQEQQIQFEPRTVMVPDKKGAQKAMARRFFEQKVEGTEDEGDDPVAALAAENQRLRETIENLKAGKITETEMEASQQRYLQGQVVAEHAPALQDLDARVATLEQAEQADASAVAQLKKEWEDLLHKYSTDTSGLNQLLQTQGTNKTYHDYIAQQVQEQIDAQTPSVGMQVHAVVQSASFRRALRRR